MSEQQYLNLLQETLINGHYKSDRTGTGTRSVFGRQMRFDLQQGFPLITTKRVFWRGLVEELLWMLRGSTNVHELQERGVHIWDPWADEDGELGPVYGAQFRNWSSGGESIDQLFEVIEQLRDNPNSRRHIVSAWNVGVLASMNLPPCHLLFQFYVVDGHLSCQLYQRSADLFLGVPFNIASYSLLTHLVARHVGLDVGEFIWIGGDCHLYANHVSQVESQLQRDPLPFPNLFWQTQERDIFKAGYYTQEELVTLVGYNPHPPLKAPVAV